LIIQLTKGNGGNGNVAWGRNDGGNGKMGLKCIEELTKKICKKTENL
jgi:hypothetical protein